MNKILKRILAVILTIIIIIWIATILIGGYFVRYALYRNGAGGNREIKNEQVKIEEKDSDKAIINKNKKEEKNDVKNWLEQTPRETLEIKAKDDITLRATAYYNKTENQENHDWVIVAHGYRSKPSWVASIGMHFYKEKGYNVLIPSMRATEESEGKYIGMGWLDKDDIIGWINKIIEKDKDAKIILHGSSMGAATVLMASGENLPSNVKAIIADSSYTSVWDIFKSELKARFNLPPFPLMQMFRVIAKIQAKYDIKEASVINQVKKSKVPILLIHGDADDFVPVIMESQIYESLPGEKDQLIVHGAGHTQSRYREPEAYYKKVFEFVDKYNN